MNARSTTLVVVLALLGLVAYSSVFVVNEWESAIRFAVGKFDRSDYKPGIHWKVPLYHQVRKFDRRILTYDAPEQRYLTKDRTPLIVDYYVKWRISDVEKFFTTMRGSEAAAVNRFNAIVNKGLLDAFGRRTEWEVISKDRAEVMRNITLKAREQVSDFGIEIVDVRTKLIELPKETFEKIYQRMRSDRLKEANERRAQGRGEAERIRAEADKERKIMLAEAYRESQQLRGQGDAKAAEIYAKAFRRNPEFYAFYRSLEAYRRSFEREGDVLVLEPDSDFFKYFNRVAPGRGR